MANTTPVLVFSSENDELADVLRAAQRAIMAHPIAAQALFSALVAEGRHFGATAEGAAWRERLAASEWFERAQIVWETVSHTSLDENGRDVLPSNYIDAIVKAATIEKLEPFLSHLFQVRGE
ncbi:MAG TPA: hypothetical protein VMI54_23850 [Polyangiaceae bacterium]|nr:hypothetical protein [Polyangiaceae bacterium]